jgi:hypothetical protein
MDELMTMVLMGSILQGVFWVAMPVLVLVGIAAAMRRSAHAARDAVLIAGAGGGDAIVQFLRSVEEAQRAFQDLPASSDMERRAKQAMILQALARISSQAGRLGPSCRPRTVQ